MHVPRTPQPAAAELDAHPFKVPAAVATCFELVSAAPSFTLRFLAVQLPWLVRVPKLCFPLLHRAASNAFADELGAPEAHGRGAGGGAARRMASRHRDRKED